MDQGVYRPVCDMILAPRACCRLPASYSHGFYTLLRIESIHTYGKDLHDGCATLVNSSGVPCKTLIVLGAKPCFEGAALSISGGTGKTHFLYTGGNQTPGRLLLPDGNVECEKVHQRFQEIGCWNRACQNAQAVVSIVSGLLWSVNPCLGKRSGHTLRKVWAQRSIFTFYRI